MMNAMPTEEFLSAVEELGIAFEDDDLTKLQQYLELLLDTNEQFNLTAIKEPEAAWMRHMYDSLTLVPLIATAEARTVIDIGSGGGLPGLPLAIVLPDVAFTLLEATGKKARFLEHVVNTLSLNNVSVVTERAETAGHDRDSFREKFDLVTARAVGPLGVLAELTLPFARVGGLVLAIKGAKANEEVAAAKRALHMLHGRVVNTLATPTGTIVILEKLRTTPRVYPRRPGEPKRAPLS